jgi:hypothetical protein
VIKNAIYPLSLLLSTASHKTCESMGELADISGDSMLRLLDKEVPLKEKCEFVKGFFKKKSLYVIVDDVLIAKIYSKIIEGTSYQYDSSRHISYQSLCSVVAMVSDGYTNLPVAHQLWVSQELLGDEYKTKTQIAMDIIKSISQFFKVRQVIADALYSTEWFIKTLYQLGFKLELKIHSNRVVILKSGEKVQIRNAFGSKLRGKRYYTTLVEWRGMSLYITAFKRYNKYDEYKIIYLVSNFSAPARDHARIYDYRWNIEKFFRTAKQHLGLKDCQSRSATRQTNHIDNVIMAYIILQVMKRKLRLKSPEAALKRLKSLSFIQLMFRIEAPDQIFHAMFS